MCGILGGSCRIVVGIVRIAKGSCLFRPYILGRVGSMARRAVAPPRCSTCAPSMSHAPGSPAEDKCGHTFEQLLTLGSTYAPSVSHAPGSPAEDATHPRAPSQRRSSLWQQNLWRRNTGGGGTVRQVRAEALPRKTEGHLQRTVQRARSTVPRHCLARMCSKLAQNLVRSRFARTFRLPLKPPGRVKKMGELQIYKCGYTFEQLLTH